MAEYIEKQAVMDKFTEVVAPSNNSDFQKAPTWNDAVEIVENFPTADVRPVVRGKWVSDEDTYPGPGMRNYKCSACGKIAGTWRKGLKKEQLYPFCPMCGADMRGGDAS